MKKYIETFKFQSIDTDTFLEFLKANIPGIENEIDLVLWTEGTGIPPDAYEPVSTLYTKILSLANEFNLGRMPREDEVADWRGQEWELYLENLPKSIDASQVKKKKLFPLKYFNSFSTPTGWCSGKCDSLDLVSLQFDNARTLWILVSYGYKKNKKKNSN